jgi:hypothetical protein
MKYSSFWPPDPTYVIKTQFYTIAYNEDSKVYTYELSGERHESTQEEMMND